MCGLGIFKTNLVHYPQTQQNLFRSFECDRFDGDISQISTEEILNFVNNKNKHVKLKNIYIDVSELRNVRSFDEDFY